MTIEKKTILITGGTSGVGLALVDLLSKTNKVYIISRQGALPEHLKQNSSIELFHADLSDKRQLEKVVDDLLRKESSIDVLFNNAAVQHTPEFLEDNFNYDGIQREVDVNFTAICHLTYLLLPALMNSSSGKIVNINSGLAIAPKRASAIYCATKSALDSFSKSLSYQLADSHVAVSQVFLPLVETNMTLGRGTKKLRPDFVAEKIWQGITEGKSVIDIGKVKLLRAINYILPTVAQNIMKRS